MSHTEFISWMEYYEEAPFDDHYRYHRPAMLVSSSMSGGKVQDKLDFLVPPKHEYSGEYSAADLRTLEAFGIKPPRV